MTRRGFALAAGGAAIAPLAPFAALSLESQCRPKAWVKDCPCPTNPADFCEGPPPFASIPANNEPWIEFSHGPCGKPHPRPLWSELNRRRNWIHACRVKDDLKRAYDKLLFRYADRDPRSLQYQAWIHGFFCSGMGKGGDIHTLWDFLPWHRAFVYFHERILADACGNPHFRIPAWDWETDLDIPEFYAKLGLPSFLTGSCKRTPHPYADLVSPCMLQSWLFSENFESFCGTGQPGCVRAYNGPHASIHNPIVGGAMSNFYTAAADPIFYANHANVDRFWRFWLNHYKRFKLPGHWLNRCYFFYDERQRLVRMRTWQMLDECSLGYTYTRDPAVDLPDFAVYRVQTHLWRDPTKLLLTILALMIGTLIGRNTPPHILEEIKKAVEDGKSHPLLPPLPARFLAGAVAHEDLGFHKVLLGGRDDGQCPPATIGAFTQFEHSMDPCVVGCMDQRVVAAILCAICSQGGLQAHLEGPTGARVPLDFTHLNQFELLYLPVAHQLGTEWIDRFGLRIPCS